MEESEWSDDSFRQVRPLEMMLCSKDWVLSTGPAGGLGAEDEEDAVDDPAAGTGPACC